MRPLFEKSEPPDRRSARPVGPDKIGWESCFYRFVVLILHYTSEGITPIGRQRCLCSRRAVPEIGNTAIAMGSFIGDTFLITACFLRFFCAD